MHMVIQIWNLTMVFITFILSPFGGYSSTPRLQFGALNSSCAASSATVAADYHHLHRHSLPQIVGLRWYSLILNFMSGSSSAGAWSRLNLSDSIAKDWWFPYAFHSSITDQRTCQVCFQVLQLHLQHAWLNCDNFASLSASYASFSCPRQTLTELINVSSWHSRYSTTMAAMGKKMTRGPGLTCSLSSKNCYYRHQTNSSSEVGSASAYLAYLKERCRRMDALS